MDEDKNTSQPGDEIATTAELAEAAVLPCVHEVHADPDACAALTKVPQRLQQEAKHKSPARWAYERLALYIQNFEQQLDAEHEVAMGFTSGGSGVMRIEGMGYFDPDILTFYSTGPDGSRSQLVQHVSQLDVLLRSVPKAKKEEPPRRIGFRLAKDLTEE
ncbi:DUF6173 family protein [Cribrihabitans neustonicus]|uniref:DUF6173 family protein n=1 Tax=Cribrihabitans neustonicus TaxID=1429085 RepID=UPI003B5C3C4C